MSNKIRIRDRFVWEKNQITIILENGKRVTLKELEQINAKENNDKKG